MRILVHSGKGGVGKTSVSAATALRCAEMGLRTLVLSTDGAHSLADSLNAELGPTPQPLSDNLWGQEVDARHSIEQHWGALQEQMAAFFRQQGLTDLHAEEISILPGLDEIAHLLWIQQHAVNGEYDAIIVDAAPTAETLRLLSLPDVTRWWFERLIQWAQGAQRWLKPISRLLAREEFPNIQKKAIEQAELFFSTLVKVREILSDSAITSIRLVVNPEEMVIKETQRMHTYLCLYGYATDAIICNRIIPPQVTDPYFAKWRTAQEKNIAYIRDAFGEIPLIRAPLFGGEVSGLPALRELADAMYETTNPTRVMLEKPPQKLVADSDGSSVLSISLPFVEHKELDLLHKQDELTLRVGNYRRNIVLPYALWKQEIVKASFSDSILHLRFEPNKPAPEHF